MLKFTNRVYELKELDKLFEKKGLAVFYGRRRIGKTRLITHWIKKKQGWYTQAIEASASLQIEQLYLDLQPYLSVSLFPKNWREFFEILSLHKGPITLCIDEFPYLVKSSPELPSLMQRWLDANQRTDVFLILTGSSQHMMHHHFLNTTSPLFGRALKVIQVKPMSYQHFCLACNLDMAQIESFNKYSLVGGVPKYWEFFDPQMNTVQLAECLYFDFAPYMEDEPRKILIDEAVNGLSPLNILEAIGRGDEKTSKIAARLNTSQTNLTRTMQILLDASIIVRDLPFGESIRSTKKYLYRIQDPCLRFWFNVFSPHRSRWQNYSLKYKQQLIHEHASKIFEDWVRESLGDPSRYWTKDSEFDVVRQQGKKIIVSEVKWKKLTLKEKRTLKSKLIHNWQKTPLASKYNNVEFQLIDSTYLREMQVKKTV